MAWKKYTPALPASTPIGVSLTIPQRGARLAPVLNLDPTIVQLLGWTADASLMIAIGDGEHDGKLRVIPMAGELTKLAPPKSKTQRRWRVRLGRMPVLTEEQTKAALVFEIDRVGEGQPNALIITLPDVARAHRLPAGTARAVATAMKK